MNSKVKMTDRARGDQKLQLGAMILLCLIGGFGCGGGGSSVPENDIVNEDVAAVLKKSAGPRKEVCWKGKSRLKEIELQREGKLRRKKLECNLITRRSLAR
ncbi:MAG: hypothetical protein ACE5FY_07750, partial [Nitrospiria bacterium]